MKTKEFADRLRAMGYIVVLDDGIFDIYDNGNAVALVYEKELFRLSLVRGKAVNKSLFDSCVEYAQTPLAEREEEKKYQFKLSLPIGIESGIYGWLNQNTDTGEFKLSSRENTAEMKTIFTELEASQMDITGFDKIEVSND